MNTEPEKVTFKYSSVEEQILNEELKSVSKKFSLSPAGGLRSG